MVMTILGIIYEIMKGFVLLLPNIIKLIDAIVEYYVNRNKRLKDAEATEEAAKKVASEREMAKAQANIAAAHIVRGEGWKINYQQILTMVQQSNLSDLLIKMQFCNWEAVSEIYYSQKPPEAKAFQLSEMLKAAG